MPKLWKMEPKGHKRRMEDSTRTSNRSMPSPYEPPTKKSNSGPMDLDQMIMDRLSGPMKKQKELSVEDLDRLEEAVCNLGQSMRIIMDLTPDVYTHKDAGIQQRLSSPRIKLAQYLTSMSNLGVLEKTEKLVTLSQKAGSDDFVNPATILPLKAMKDDLVAQFHGHEEISKQKASTRKREEITKSKKEVLNKSNVVANWPPTLPEITDEALRKQVFTHKSVACMHHYLTDVELMDVHNERLEFLGDSIINSLIAVIAYDRFPYMHEGDLSNIRTALITNNTLSEWAKIYEMDSMLKYYEPQESKQHVVGGRGAAASTPKYIADVFEAYVGGLWVLHGASSESVSVIRPWLEELASPMLTSIEQVQEGLVPLDYEAKKSLYTKIGSQTLSPKYVTMKTMPNGFVCVECRMGADVLASGTARTAKEAGLRAAMKVLQQKEVVDKYAQLRREVPRVIASDIDVSSKPVQQPIPSTKSTPTPTTTTVTISDLTALTSSSDPTKRQLDFITKYEAEFAINPKKFFENLVGKPMLNFVTTQLRNDASGKEVFESTLHFDGIKLKNATGHSVKSAEKRAAYFSLSKDYNTILDWINRTKTID